MLGFGRLLRWILENKAKKNKKRFVNKFATIITNLQVDKDIDLNMVSFCGKKSLADQLLSITSFYKNVGKPNSWNIYSDGTLQDNDIALLETIDKVRVLPFVLDQADDAFRDYIIKYPTAKKIFILKSLKINSTTLFADSDIVFYSKFKEYIPTFMTGNWYIVDAVNGYFDEEYLAKYPNEQNPLNLGLMVLNKQPDWSFVTSYLLKKWNNGTMHYWSDQTACNIMSKQDALFNPLPYNEFPTGGNDAFKFNYAFDETKIAIRHFCGPVRHKMWQKEWQEVLSANK